MRAFLLFLIPLMLAAEPASIQWTEKLSRNMASTVTGLPAVLSEATKTRELKLGSHQYSVPFVKDGRIYVGTNDWNVGKTGRFKRTKGGLVAALDEETGELIWQLPVPKTELRGEYHFNIFNCGVCSSPTVSGDRMYIIGSRGNVLCLDTKGQSDGNDGPFMDELIYLEDALVNQDAKLQPDDGDIIWTYDLIKEEHIFPHDVLASTPLLLNGFLYICTSNGQRGDHKTVANPDAASLIVLDAQTGQLVARDAENIGHRVLHGMWSSPSYGKVSGKDLIFWGGGDGYLYAFEAVSALTESVQSLTCVWRYDCNPQDYRKQADYSSFYRKISTGPSQIIATPVFYKNKVYVAIGQSPYHGPGQGMLSCVDALTGNRIWESRLVDRTTATAAIADDLLYLPDFSGNFHCFDAATGKRHWVHKMKSGAWTSSPLVADGKVYVGDDRNQFYIFKADTTAELLSSARLDSMALTVVAHNQKLYVPTQKRLHIFQNK